MSESTKSPKPAHTGGRDRKDGKDGKKGSTLKHKGRPPEKKPAEPEGKIASVTSVVYRAAGVQVVKRSRVSYPGAKVVDVAYTVEFEGHEAISFTRMGEAVERAKGAPPEPVAAAQESAEASESVSAVESDKVAEAA